MTTNQPQDRLPGDSGETEPAMTAKGASRRRFGRAGLGASGVLMTLASQPAMAQALCATASGSLSTGMQSRHGTQPLPLCEGDSPGNLVAPTQVQIGAKTAESNGKQADDEVHGGMNVKASGRRFRELYSTSHRALGQARINALLEACVKQQPLYNKGNEVIVDAATVQVAGHMIAAMLNWQARKTTVNDEQKLKSIWNAYELSNRGVQGFYAPSATVKWYHDGIVRYIKTTYKGGAIS